MPFGNSILLTERQEGHPKSGYWDSKTSYRWILWDINYFAICQVKNYCGNSSLIFSLRGPSTIVFA